jgi:hypothetical protein
LSAARNCIICTSNGCVAVIPSAMGKICSAAWAAASAAAARAALSPAGVSVVIATTMRLHRLRRLRLSARRQRVAQQRHVRHRLLKHLLHVNARTRLITELPQRVPSAHCLAGDPTVNLLKTLAGRWVVRLTPVLGFQFGVVLNLELEGRVPGRDKGRLNT